MFLNVYPFQWENYSFFDKQLFFKMSCLNHKPDDTIWSCQSFGFSNKKDERPMVLGWPHGVDLKLADWFGQGELDSKHGWNTWVTVMSMEGSNDR